MVKDMHEIEITTEFIKLDQLLKFCGICFDGVEAKNVIKSGIVFVNDEKEIRRGRKIYRDDKITLKNDEEDIVLLVK